MIKKIFLLLTFICLTLACEGVEDIFKDKKPVISDDGIQFSTSDIVYPSDTVKAWISASNPDKGPLEYKWSERLSRGVFAGANDRDTVRWYATSGGSYNLKIKVTNDKGSASTDRDITVISPQNPLVNITSPKENEYFVISQTVEINVIADHANGIASVRFYANDSLAAQLPGNLRGTYEFDLNLDRPELVGKTVIKVEAVSTSTTTGSDEITIDVGGIIPGKHGN